MTSDTPLPTKQPKHEILYWVNNVRVILCLCLVYYHNHRLLDSYAYNIDFEIPEEYYTLISMIKLSNRITVQVGLNLVCK